MIGWIVGGGLLVVLLVGNALLGVCVYQAWQGKEPYRISRGLVVGVVVVWGFAVYDLSGRMKQAVLWSSEFWQWGLIGIISTLFAVLVVLGDTVLGYSDGK